MSSYLLLTGAAGLVGQYLVRDLLVRETPIAVLMRSNKGQTPEGRIEQIMTRLEGELGRALPRPVCLHGDITQPGLGLTHDAARWVAGHCRRFLHNAASVTFRGADRERDPWLSNVTGTEHVLEFCRRAEIREFHYMSTAYVCGRRADSVLEDDDAGAASFRTDYEHSKAEAERLVRAADFLEPPTFYRPATIVGDSCTGRTTTYHGLYHYLRFVSLLQQSACLDKDGYWQAPVRFNLTGNERRNFVPVDWVSAVCTHILLDPDFHGRTYHLTPLRAITMREVDEAMSCYFKYYGPTFVGPDGLAGAELNDIEKLFYGQMAEYAPYWGEEPAFDCRNTLAVAGHLPCPTASKELIGRLIDYARDDRWGKRR